MNGDLLQFYPGVLFLKVNLCNTLRLLNEVLEHRNNNGSLCPKQGLK
ncbi:hypothetical protein Mic7113_0015 [Allocoleopsis franciscana PCC 7113]|uniref:Uncharacterized protein n=1 Tax=Allocoleopsis franciscana PCC 7113 TaxID=1173027 RepID=K9W8W4_9CYAN|nr:hypothetical protein Mic7113_0015 [Allocoleopsis franciscana PCC 7113]